MEDEALLLSDSHSAEANSEPKRSGQRRRFLADIDAETLRGIGRVALNG